MNETLYKFWILLSFFNVILGGAEVTLGEFPHQALLGYQSGAELNWRGLKLFNFYFNNYFSIFFLYFNCRFSLWRVIDLETFRLDG
jgi:hypothetical protein